MTNLRIRGMCRI
ncbi:hypothetical protein NAI63_13675, partial [Francisella tularensis subsp. holarctica]|nr:hypothetical protein [Francisella tularensis subsp. holarctica]